MKVVKDKKKTEKGSFYRRTCSYCGNVVEFFHSKKPDVCPFCGSTNYIKPKTETKLFLLQKKYFETKDRDYLARMYEILVQYARSKIKTELGRKQITKYHYEGIDMKAMDAASLIIEQYLIRPSFKIDQSFSGYLDYKIPEVLYNKKERREEAHISYNATVFDSEGEEVELQDLGKDFNFSYIFGDENEYLQRLLDKRELFSGLEKILNQIVKNVTENYDKKDCLNLLLGLWISLSGNRNLDMDNFYRYFGSDYKQFIDMSILFIYEFIKESLKFKNEEN